MAEAEQHEEFYNYLFRLDDVPEKVLKAIKSPGMNADAIDLVRKAAPKIEDPWSWGPAFMADILRTVAVNTAVPDENLPPMVEAFRAVVPKARAFLDSPECEKPTFENELTEKFLRTVHDFSERSDISDARRAAFKQCLDIINETFGKDTGIVLTLEEPGTPRSLPSGPGFPEPGPGSGKK